MHATRGRQKFHCGPRPSWPDVPSLRWHVRQTCQRGTFRNVQATARGGRDEAHAARLSSSTEPPHPSLRRLAPLANEAPAPGRPPRSRLRCRRRAQAREHLSRPGRPRRTCAVAEDMLRHPGLGLMANMAICVHVSVCDAVSRAHSISGFHDAPSTSAGRLTGGIPECCTHMDTGKAAGGHVPLLTSQCPCA